LLPVIGLKDQFVTTKWPKFATERQERTAEDSFWEGQREFSFHPTRARGLEERWKLPGGTANAFSRIKKPRKHIK